MKGRLLAGLVVLFAIAGSARAGPAAETAAAWREWVRKCFEALNSADPMIRGSGRAALAALDATVLEAGVANLGQLQTPTAWRELAKLAETAGEPWVAVLEMGRSNWPAAAREELDAVLTGIRRGPALTPTVPRGAMDSRVAEVLSGLASSDVASTESIATRKLIALGRDAVPAILRAVKHAHEEGNGAQEATAAYALARLATASDAPALADLLAAGIGAIALALRALPSDVAAEILSTSIDRDMMTAEMMLALRTLKPTPRLVSAVGRWMERNAGTGDVDSLVQVAVGLGRFGTEDSARGIRRVLSRSVSVDQRVKLLAAMGALGDLDAINLLVDVLPVNGQRDLAATEAVELLLGDLIPRDVWPIDREAGKRSPETLDVDALRRWWTGARSTFRFDWASRTWRRG